MASNDADRVNLLKLMAAPDAATKLEQAAKLNEIAYLIKVQGDDPTTWLLPSTSATLTRLGTAQSGNSSTTKYFTVPKQYIDEIVIIGISGSGGATPTVTLKVQGSVDSAFTSPISLSVAISSAPTTFSTTIAAVVDSGAWSKTYIVKPGQAYKYLRVNYSLNTNVTALAADMWYMGDAGTFT
jgi:hypothetical protein